MKSGQAVSPELREWVAAQLAAGHSVPSLRASMRAAGWHDDAADVVNEAPREEVGRPAGLSPAEAKRRRRCAGGRAERGEKAARHER